MTSAMDLNINQFGRPTQKRVLAVLAASPVPATVLVADSGVTLADVAQFLS